MAPANGVSAGRTMSVSQITREQAPGRPEAPPAFHLLAKPTGAVCNLDCAYCFFLSKEMLYPGSRFRMADELLEEYVRQLIEAHAGVPEVVVAWQGGEPTLMGARLLPALGRAREPAPPARPAGRLHDPDERHAARRGVGPLLQGERLPRRRLDRRAARAARRLPREQGRQGQLRPGDARARRTEATAGSSGTRSRRSTRPTPTTAATSTASSATSSARSFVQFIPIIERVAEADADGTVPWTSWRDRPLYVQDGDAGHRALHDGRAVRPLPDRRVRGVGAPRCRRGLRADVRRHARELGRRAAGPLRPLRDLRARPRARAHGRPLLLRPLRRARLQARQHQRDAMLELVASPQQRQFGLDKRETLPSFCLECDVRFACHGGCPKDRFITRPTVSPASTTSAPASRTSSTTSTRRCGSWAGCSPSTAPRRRSSQLYAAEDAQRGRNDPCTCGSGRKWKHCHGAELVEALL